MSDALNGGHDQNKVTLTPFFLKKIKNRNLFIKLLFSLFLFMTLRFFILYDLLSNQWPLREAAPVAALNYLVVENGGLVTARGSNLPLCKADQLFSKTENCHISLAAKSYAVCDQWIYNPFYKDTCISIRIDWSYSKDEKTLNILRDLVTDICGILIRSKASEQILQYGKCGSQSRGLDTFIFELDDDGKVVGQMTIRKARN